MSPPFRVGKSSPDRGEFRGGPRKPSSVVLKGTAVRGDNLQPEYKKKASYFVVAEVGATKERLASSFQSVQFHF
jgi:hypothetical protein